MVDLCALTGNDIHAVLLCCKSGLQGDLILSIQISFKIYRYKKIYGMRAIYIHIYIMEYWRLSFNICIIYMEYILYIYGIVFYL